MEVNLNKFLKAEENKYNSLSQKQVNLNCILYLVISKQHRNFIT